MKQYTRKQLREFVQLGLAVDLTEAEPEKIPASYTKVGYYVILARNSLLFRVF